MIKYTECVYVLGRFSFIRRLFISFWRLEDFRGLLWAFSFFDGVVSRAVFL